jgi:hypothetical protein
LVARTAGSKLHDPRMTTDLRFVLQFNYGGGYQAALEAVQTLLPGAVRERGALMYRNNVLQFQKSPLFGDSGEKYHLEISVFPVLDANLMHQQLVLREVRAALCSVAGEVDVLAESEILQDER